MRIRRLALYALLLFVAFLVGLGTRFLTVALAVPNDIASWILLFVETACVVGIIYFMQFRRHRMPAASTLGDRYDANWNRYNDL